MRISRRKRYRVYRFLRRNNLKIQYAVDRSRTNKILRTKKHSNDISVVGFFTKLGNFVSLDLTVCQLLSMLRRIGETQFSQQTSIRISFFRAFFDRVCLIEINTRNDSVKS